MGRGRPILRPSCSNCAHWRQRLDDPEDTTGGICTWPGFNDGRIKGPFWFREVANYETAASEGRGCPTYVAMVSH